MANARDDQLETLWCQASHDENAEAALLRELSEQRVMVILRQPPGSGDAAPERNLVQCGMKPMARRLYPSLSAAPKLASNVP